MASYLVSMGSMKKNYLVIIGVLVLLLILASGVFKFGSFSRSEGKYYNDRGDYLGGCVVIEDRGKSLTTFEFYDTHGVLVGKETRYWGSESSGLKDSCEGNLCSVIFSGGSARVTILETCEVD